MKKSEMLGKLYNLLYCTTDLNEVILEKLCVNILDEVEKAGMHPPYSQKLLKEQYGNFVPMNLYSIRWEEE